MFLLVFFFLILPLYISAVEVTLGNVDRTLTSYSYFVIASVISHGSLVLLLLFNRDQNGIRPIVF